MTGDPAHPVSEGYTCPKGRALPEVHHDPARLDDPSWEQTLDGLAARLAEIIDRHGPGAIGGYRATHWAFDATGRAMAERFFRALPTGQLYSAVTVDAPNKTLVPDLITGAPFLFPGPRLGHAPGSSSWWARTRWCPTAIRWPAPTPSWRCAACGPGAGRLSWPTRERRRPPGWPTSTSRCGPGRIRRCWPGWCGRSWRPAAADTAFLADCADPASVESLGRLVEPFTPEVVADRCEIDRAVVEEVVRLVLAAGRVAVQTGTGVSMGPAPNVGEWLGWALGAVTGSLDRPGGVLFNPGVLRPQEERLVTRPRHSGGTGTPGGGPASRPDLRAAYGELPCTALADEIDAGTLRALFVLGGNPLTTLPDSDRLRRSFATLDVLAVCDIRSTETTAVATHVLPVAGQLERADMTSFLDLAFPFPFAQYGPAAVPAHPGRPPMWRIFAGLGRRLGLAGFADVGARDRRVPAGRRRPPVPRALGRAGGRARRGSPRRARPAPAG